MVDGSHLSFRENVSYTKFISLLAHSKGLLVEAELGRLSGTEDDLTVEDYEARLTDVKQVFILSNFVRPVFHFMLNTSKFIRRLHKFQAQEFIDETGIDALAVCIGNVHGKYPASGPNLRLDLLKVNYNYFLYGAVLNVHQLQFASPSSEPHISSLSGLLTLLPR